MTTEHQQDLASLYALGALPESERAEFENELRGNPELLTFTRSLLASGRAIALSAPPVELPPGLRAKVLQRIEAAAASVSNVPVADPRVGLSFLMGAEATGWKQLPIPGARIKLLSLERERGYAVLLGKLDPGARYPAHVNAGAEDFYILTGDLHIGDTVLQGGDFHHAEAGSQHEENFSENGCTLLAVLTVDDPLVAFAMA